MATRKKATAAATPAKPAAKPAPKPYLVDQERSSGETMTYRPDDEYEKILGWKKQIEDARGDLDEAQMVNASVWKRLKKDPGFPAEAIKQGLKELSMKPTKRSAFFQDLDLVRRAFGMTAPRTVDVQTTLDPGHQSLKNVEPAA
jgi:hypothetical protein